MQMSDPECSTSQAQHPGAGPPTSSQTSTNHNNSKRTRQQPILKYCPAPILNEEKIEFHSLLLEFQAKANLLESFVSQQSFRRLIKFCNTATCERLFSELAQIHTARRNRLQPDKVKKLSIIRQTVRKKNAIELQSQ
jgi:hypothetical protein